MVDDEELDDDEHHEDDDADDEVAADDELAERHDDVRRPRRCPPMPCISTSRVDATFSDSRTSVSNRSSDGKTENSTGCLT